MDNCTSCSTDLLLGALAAKDKRLAAATLLVYQQALLMADIQERNPHAFVEGCATYANVRVNFLQQCRTLNAELQEDCLGTVFEDLVKVLPEFIACLGGTGGGGFFACLITLLPVAIRLILCLISNRSTAAQLDLGQIFGCAVQSLDFQKFIDCLVGGNGGGGGGGPVPYNPNQQARC